MVILPVAVDGHCRDGGIASSIVMIVDAVMIRSADIVAPRRSLVVTSLVTGAQSDRIAMCESIRQRKRTTEKSCRGLLRSSTRSPPDVF